MIRTGETVFVPMRRNLIRCGMSEPVMKTARSSTFSGRSEVWLTGGPPNTVAAKMLTVTRIRMVEQIRALTRGHYSLALAL